MPDSTRRQNIFAVLLVCMVLLGLLVGVRQSFSSALDTSEMSGDSPLSGHLLLEEAYWWSSQGELEPTLESLEELRVYCEMNDETWPVEAEELYQDTLEEWEFYGEGPPLSSESESGGSDEY